LVYKRTPRGNTVLLLSAVFITLGLVAVLESTFALLLAGIGLFLYYYVSKLVLQIKTKALDLLEVRRAYTKRIAEESEVEVTVSFVNRTFIRVRAEVMDAYPPLFRLKVGSNAVVLAIPAKGYARMIYSLTPTSVGSHPFGDVNLITRDIAGLFYYERRIPATDTIEVTPSGDEIARGALTAMMISAYGGSITSRRKGEGMDFADIRKYAPGDPFKRIEWSSTARTGKLMLKETHAETQLNVMLILDITETMAYGEAGVTKLDYAARAVASLLAYLTGRGDLVGLTLVGGKDTTEVIPIARGRLQTTRIMRRLSSVRTTPSQPAKLSIGVKRALALGRVKGRTLFFVITDLESEVDLAALKHLVGMKHEVIVISPFTPLFEAHGLEGLDKTIYSINTTYQWRTRKRIVREAAKLGIRVLDVGPKDFFPKLVARVEEMRRRGGS
jgi:uncharacterized protein (DUF58 family)